MMLKFVVSLFLFGLLLVEVKPRLKVVEPTKGSPWPLPKRIGSYECTCIIRPDSFKIVSPKTPCRIINEAINRYHKIISKSVTALKGGTKYFNTTSSKSKNYGYLEKLEIRFTGRCETTPYFKMLESYILEINGPDAPNKAILSSKSVWGVLRGLETFSQLIFPSDSDDSLKIKTAWIKDEPRFPHRGLMIDTARHYLPVDIIKSIIDAMEYNKMNVLHWHIVDDESFPYQSESFPELSAQGAYDSRLLIYSYFDISNIVDYASLRGVRVIPEFDSPEHTLSWGQGRENLLTKCYNMQDEYGPIDPTNDNNYYFLKQLFTEVAKVFPDKYLHLGGDQGDNEFNCWKSNPSIKHFMETHNMTDNYKALKSYYIKKLLNIVQDDLNTNTLMWQDILFDDGFQVSSKTRSRLLVHVRNVTHNGYETEMSKITSAGYSAILSTCWQLDKLQLSGKSWDKLYRCNPLNFYGSDEQYELVMGGEAIMRGEDVDEANILQRIWPLASATAEKLWSPEQSSIDFNYVERRIEEHTCRMRQRGIPAQPANGPGFCIL